MRNHKAIAIIGIGCRFPGDAHGPSSFWDMLCRGFDAVTEIPPDRWNISAYYDEVAGLPGKTNSRWGGVIDGVDQFDPAFFGISPREAAYMDPQQRLLLETAWESIEDAGLKIDPASGSNTGVFVGISTVDYSLIQSSFSDKTSLEGHTTTGTVHSIAANRISYLLNFRGPNFAVDTACSSSLVAVHLACQSLNNGECATALAGGVNAILIPDTYIGFSKMSMLSPDGRCKAFDRSGNGFVRGEGAGVIVLKPLVDALADNDRVYAVIIGSAVNQDGHTSSLTVPSAEAQKRLISDACRDAGVNPLEIDYVEAHGTGTAVGDPIEASAIGSVLGDKPRRRPCVIGSVKTNIGHLEAGSGIAGIIKTALTLHHGKVPPNLHFKEPNPDIDFKKLQLHVPVTVEKLPRKDAIAGVNSFGFGGTNAHVVLQAIPQQRHDSPSEAPQASLLMLSARDLAGLRLVAGQYANWLASTGESLENICHTLATRRNQHSHRMAIAAVSKADAIEKLQAYLAGEARPGLSSGVSVHGQKTAFVFTGQGPQWWGMGRELLASNEVFRRKIEECDSLFRMWGDWSLIEELSRDEKTSRIGETSIAQPAIFAIQIGLAAWWATQGIKPDAVIGHSVGEAAAAHLSGALDLASAAKVIFHRGRCMQLVPPNGRMLAVALSTEAAVPWIKGFENLVEIGAVNSPRSITLSGDPTALETIASKLEFAKVWCRFLRVQYAFHSSQMNPIKAKLKRSLTDINSEKPVLPICSTVMGRLSGGEKFDAEYWWHNVRKPVLFSDGINELIDAGFTTFLEIGPHPALSGSVSECLKAKGAAGIVAGSLRRGEPELASLLGSLGKLHVHGDGVSLISTGHAVDLPLHPWQHDRYWHEAAESAATRLNPLVHPLLGRAINTACPLWETKLNAALLPYLNDHRINGRVVFPAAGYVEMALAAGRQLHRESPLVIEEIEFHRALFLPESDSTLRLQLGCTAEEGIFQINVKADTDRVWNTHCSGRINTLPQGTRSSSLDLNEIKHRCTEEMSGSASYEIFNKNGFGFGESFRGISRIWRRDGEALGEIQAPKKLKLDEYLIHPALIDACFQTLLATLTQQESGRGLFLPTQLKRLRFFASTKGKIWSHVRLSESTEKTITAEIRLLNENGCMLADITGFRCAAVERPPAQENESERCIYEMAWKDQERKPASPLDANLGWLLLGSQTTLMRSVADRLKAKGVSCESGKHFSDVRACLANRSNASHVVFFTDFTPEVDKESANRLSCDLLGVVQQLAEVRADLRLSVITRATQSIDQHPHSVSHGAVAALARVVMNEHPALRCRIIDIDADEAAVDLTSLVEELHVVDEEEIALRGIQRFVSRIVRLSPKAKCVSGKIIPFRLEVVKSGALDQIEFHEISRRSPLAGEVEVEVRAAGLNFRDVMKVLGIYPVEQPDDQLLGDECSGVVVGVGEGVEQLRVGDEVIVISPGCFSKYVTVHSQFVVRKPKIISFEEAVTIPVAFLTASYALQHLARIEHGERILIHAAAGGVGLAAMQIARQAGLEIFATAGNDEKRELVRSLGAAHVMDSRTLDFADEVMEITAGRGVDVVLNSLAGEAISKSLSVLAPYGRFLEIGKRDIYQNSRLGLRPFSRNLSFFAIDLSRLLRDRTAFIAGRMGELIRRFESKELVPIPNTVYPIKDAVAAFRQMASGRHTGKIVFSFADTGSLPVRVSKDKPIQFQSDATYLISGGVSGFGLLVADWMIGLGAKNLMLIGLTDGSAKSAQSRFSGPKYNGMRILAKAADVCDPSALDSLFEELKLTMPPLGGVIHAAMKIDDGVLQQLTSDRFRGVMGPKAGGAWNLHLRTREQPLDFFVMFSSISSLFGNPGQGSYASANGFLDTLSHHRRALGLPSLTVNWGHLGEVGYASRNTQISEYLNRIGIPALNPQKALQLLGLFLQSDVTQAAAMEMDWKQWAEANPRVKMSSRYSDIISTEISLDVENKGTARIGNAILNSSGKERYQLLQSFVQETAARVLGTSPSKLDPERALNTLGLDSLMGIELINRIETGLGFPFPTARITGEPSIKMLAKILAESLPDPQSQETR